jgi:hypothetical protein
MDKTMVKDFGIEMLNLRIAFQEQMRISSVSRDAPKVVSDLANFNLRQTVALVAGLLVSPELHANTVRVEAFQHLVCLNCNGQRIPVLGDLAEWLNHHLGSAALAVAEDPPEDVFISNVITHRGNNRIFEGIWEVNDFYLQQVADVALSFPREHPLRKTLKNIMNLLALSEAIAARLNFPRFMSGGGNPKDDLQFPAWDILIGRARAVSFTPADLKLMDVEEETLAPFVMPLSTFPELLNATVGHSKLERFPLLRLGEDFIVALPTAIGAAARAFLLEEVSRCGEAEHFVIHLRGQQVDATFNRAVRDLRAEILFDEKLPPKPEGIPPLDDIVCQFDEGKFAHVVLIQDDTPSRLKEGFTSFKLLNNDADQRLADYLETVAKSYAAHDSYTGGLTVVVLGGLGGAVALGLRSFPDRWHTTVFNLADFVLLGQLERVSLLRLWKLKREVERMKHLGLEFINSNGDLNMLALWHSRNYSLTPNDLPLGESVCWPIKSNHVLDLRQTLRRTFDKHAVHCLSPHAWILVQRESPRTLFRQAKDLPVFVSPEALRAKRLVGVVETQRRPWWLVSDQQFSTPDQRALQRGIWRGFLFWLHKLAQTMDADSRFDVPKARPVHVFLRYEGIPSNNEKDWDFSARGRQPLRAELRPDENAVIIDIPLDHFPMFILPDNAAEFNIVAAIAHAVSHLGSKPLSQDEAVAMTRIMMGSPDARLVHVTSPRTFRERARTVREYKPRFLSEEDVDAAQIGLGRDVQSRPAIGREIHGVQECNAFLHVVTDKLWGRLAKTLSALDRESVIISALENIEGIAAEENNWRFTARALLSLYADQEDVIQGARKRDSERAVANLASRIVVEMAICASSLKGGRRISKSDFDELLANVEQLILAGHQSDAVVNGFVAPALIRIHPSSRYWMDGSFNNEVVAPYWSGHFKHGFMAASENYESHFERHEPDPRYLEKILPQEFQAAVQSEFGISAQKLFDTDLALEDFALRKESPILTIKQSELFALLKDTPGLSSDEIESLFKHFSLFPRQRWDEKSPRGFERKEWYPWAFRRQLSLLRRPFVRLDNDPDPRIILSPGLFFAALGYVLEGALDGNFQDEYFASASMRAWITKTRAEKGNALEQNTAAKFRELGLQAEASIQMTAFKASSVLGDVDTLAFDAKRKRLFVVECKHLLMARTIGEIGHQLDGFQKAVKGDFPKHLARCEYLRNHLTEVSRFLHIDVSGCGVDAVIVTNTIVPLQFMSGLRIRKEKIVSVDELTKLLN